MGKRLPPMLKQYRQIKARYPDAIVLFRLGDFYEMFEEDAKTAARELGLVLTSRRFSKEIRLPMCGIPHQRLTSYVGRLLHRGHKVAVVEQLEDARKVKRLVRRDVVRVITPGTVVEEALLRDRLENYLAAVVRGKEGYGLALVDLSTGEFLVTQINGPDAEGQLLEELARVQPSEYVLPESLAADEDFIARLHDLRPARISPLADERFVTETARACLHEHFGVASLEAFGCADLPLAIGAAGGVLQYLKENVVGAAVPGAPTDLAHLNRLTTYHRQEYMVLDATTRRNLELTRTLRDGTVQGSLLGVLDHTCTRMGARLLRRWLLQPLLNRERIQERLDAVEELVQNAFLRSDLRALLDGLYDVERLVGRIGFGSANARDLVALRRTLERLPRIRRLLAKAQSPRLRTLYEDLDELRDVAAIIGRAIVDDPPILVREGGLIRRGYHEELDRLRDLAAEGRRWLSEYEAQERERTGIKNLRVKYNQVFGFFIEVTKSNLPLVPPDYERRATITHAERFVTPELKAREAEILAAEDRCKDLEYDLFVEVRQQVAAHAARLSQAARILAELDALASLGEAAARYGYTRPTVDDGPVIEVKEGRHPVVERLLPDGQRFVPNDALLNDDDHRLVIITAPNMAGKSVYIRQVALIALMAQMGSFVPAAAARVGLVDRIFTRVGATDDISRGCSTFLVEMSETGYILRHATPHSLVILDEVGRGTSTYDGMSIAWAVAEELHALGARTLFATHYYELTALAEQLPGARNYTLAVREHEGPGKEIVFLYRLIPGGADKSYGIQVARLAGLPERVVRRALEVMKTLAAAGARPMGASLAPAGSVPRGAEQSLPDQSVTGREQPLTPAPAEAAVHPAPAGSVTRRPEQQIPKVLREVGERYLLPVDDEELWEVIRRLYTLDIGNTTPVQALVLLNELQQMLKTCP